MAHLEGVQLVKLFSLLSAFRLLELMVGDYLSVSQLFSGSSRLRVSNCFRICCEIYRFNVLLNYLSISLNKSFVRFIKSLIPPCGAQCFLRILTASNDC